MLADVDDSDDDIHSIIDRVLPVQYSMVRGVVMSGISSQHSQRTYQ
jgi:hypothetical protein